MKDLKYVTVKHPLAVCMMSVSSVALGVLQCFLETYIQVFHSIKKHKTQYQFLQPPIINLPLIIPIIII